MKIRKAYQGTVPGNKILDTYSTSQTDTYSCNYSNRFTTYSTTEQKVGKWTDGKDIYRKVFTGSSIGDINTGLTTIDNIVKMEMLIRENSSSQAWRNIPWLFNGLSASWMGGFFFKASDGVIVFQIGNDLANIDRYIIILEYTKTTD